MPLNMDPIGFSLEHVHADFFDKESARHHSYATVVDGLLHERGLSKNNWMERRI